MTTLLDVQDLHVRFQRPEGTIHAVNGVSFQVRQGEWLGVLGESGSGKSVSFLSLLKLFDSHTLTTSGSAWFEGVDLLSLSEKKLQRIRGKSVGVVFQNLMSGLNPFLRIGQQLMEPMIAHNLCTKQEAERRALVLLQEMGLPDPERQFHAYSYELSGGMRQRVMTAIAMACEPKLLIADEPTTALDATVQTQVLKVMREAAERRNMTAVMITHDLGVATNVCDRILVMYGGQVMEVADVDDFIQRPAHPYTLGLKESMIDLRALDRPLKSIPGAIQTLWAHPNGCPFAPRCMFAVSQCHTERPKLQPMASGHEVACHRVEEVLHHVG